MTKTEQLVSRLIDLIALQTQFGIDGDSAGETADLISEIVRHNEPVSTSGEIQVAQIEKGRQ